MKKLLLSLLATTTIIGCGTSSSFFPPLNAQEGQDLGEPAEIIPASRFLQIDLEVPFRPTLFPSGGDRYMVYELNITNQIPLDYTLDRLEVLDADTEQTVATFTGSALREIVRVTGEPELDTTTEEPVGIPKGQRAIAFFFLSFPNSESVPDNVRHRLIFGTPDGEMILNGSQITAVDQSPPVALEPPLEGGPWFCDGAPGVDSYHRRTLLSIDGQARISQRYAIDFEVLTSNGTTYNGDPAVNENYPAYGQPILAAASGTVVRVIDGNPDNTPPEVPPFSNVDNVGGNGVILDIGNGRYLVHGHMQPNSILVQEGDQVVVGETLGLIGNSGNSFEPHLHIQVCDQPSFLGAQGLPWVMTEYELVQNNTTESVQNELPLLNQVVQFSGNLAFDTARMPVAARTHPVCGWH